MTKREVVKAVFAGNKPPYVPWSFGFTYEAGEKLKEHLGGVSIDDACGNHFVGLGSGVGFFEKISDNVYRDVFGVEWDRSVDKDIGVVCNCVLPEPALSGYTFPDPEDERFFRDIPAKLQAQGDRFRVFQIGFSLYERAWAMRGMENLMMDFYDNPGFVHELFDAIVEYNIAQARKAMRFEIDAVHFGDDWGQQHGLQMGPDVWREFILPAVEKMYSAVHDAGRYVSIHSCGDVHELFDDLVDAGLNCFNPFQPEVMDVDALMRKYRGRLCFHGGLSTQKTLPYGTPEDVRRETRHLLDLGREGGYIFAPAHAVEGDVPLENMLAFIDEVKKQNA